MCVSHRERYQINRLCFCVSSPCNLSAQCEQGSWWRSDPRVWGVCVCYLPTCRVGRHTCSPAVKADGSSPRTCLACWGACKNRRKPIINQWIPKLPHCLVMSLPHPESWPVTPRVFSSALNTQTVRHQLDGRRLEPDPYPHIRHCYWFFGMRPVTMVVMATLAAGTCVCACMDAFRTFSCAVQSSVSPSSVICRVNKENSNSSLTCRLSRTSLHPPTCRWTNASMSSWIVLQRPSVARLRSVSQTVPENNFVWKTTFEGALLVSHVLLSPREKRSSLHQEAPITSKDQTGSSLCFLLRAGVMWLTEGANITKQSGSRHQVNKSQNWKTFSSASQRAKKQTPSRFMSRREILD